MSEVLRVLIADDHVYFREGMRGLLRTVGGIEIVAEAGDGESAVRLAAQFQPDVALMDLRMPGLDGIEATRRITATSPHIGVLVLTMLEDDDSVFAAMRAGARGYLLKGASQEEITRAIKGVSNGEAIFGPGVARRLVGYFEAGRSTPPPAFPDLTEREREILQLIAQGLTNAEIAERLYVSVKTVRNHVTNVFGKLQVADRAQAVIRAREAGLR